MSSSCIFCSEPVQTATAQTKRLHDCGFLFLKRHQLGDRFEYHSNIIRGDVAVLIGVCIPFALYGNDSGRILCHKTRQQYCIGYINDTVAGDIAALQLRSMAALRITAVLFLNREE